MLPTKSRSVGSTKYTTATVMRQAMLMEWVTGLTMLRIRNSVLVKGLSVSGAHTIAYSLTNFPSTAYKNTKNLALLITLNSIFIGRVVMAELMNYSQTTARMCSNHFIFFIKLSCMNLFSLNLISPVNLFLKFMCFATI